MVVTIANVRQVMKDLVFNVLTSMNVKLALVSVHLTLIASIHPAHTHVSVVMAFAVMV